ncbi:MAG TPA: hypothetical protein VEC19_06630 [Usitatibacter sp.]|nr:hypothetical protein [Usitatibacter sp.]
MELKPDALAAQRAYARWLTWGTRLGLGLLVASFAAYVLGLAPHVPIERLPQLWQRPASDLLAATGVRAGWGWAAMLPASDMLVMAAIAILATCSIPCLLVAAIAFGRQRERVLVAVCVMTVAVLALAISGVLAVAH